jgi:hypothetical protein
MIIHLGCNLHRPECLLIIQLSIPSVVQTFPHPHRHGRRLVLNVCQIIGISSTNILPYSDYNNVHIASGDEVSHEALEITLNRWSKRWPVILQHPLLLVDFTGR